MPYFNYYNHCLGAFIIFYTYRYSRSHLCSYLNTVILNEPVQMVWDNTGRTGRAKIQLIRASITRGMMFVPYQSSQIAPGGPRKKFSILLMSYEMVFILYRPQTDDYTKLRPELAHLQELLLESQFLLITIKRKSFLDLALDLLDQILLFLLGKLLLCNLHLHLVTSSICHFC
jgi:hypothetical protein